MRAHAESDKLRKRYRKSEEERKELHRALLKSKQKHDEDEEQMNRKNSFSRNSPGLEFRKRLSSFELKISKL